MLRHDNVVRPAPISTGHKINVATVALLPEAPTNPSMAKERLIAN